MGIGIATIVRVFLFLAILGVVVATATSPAHTLDPGQPGGGRVPHRRRRDRIPFLRTGAALRGDHIYRGMCVYFCIVLKNVPQEYRKA